MNFKKVMITDKIHLFLFNTQKDAASTFMRFEESYESPKFRGKVFSFEEFKKWYIKNSPNSQRGEIFTYYTDWTAFNVPSYVLKPFYDGKFNPLSSQEKKVLDMLKHEPHPFYIIALHKQTEDMSSVLDHEVAHGLFHLDKDYSRAVFKLLANYNVEPIKNKLRMGGGYHEETMTDEVQALIIDGNEECRNLISNDLAESLKRLYQKYLNINNASLPTIN